MKPILKFTLSVDIEITDPAALEKYAAALPNFSSEPEPDSPHSVEINRQIDCLMEALQSASEGVPGVEVMSMSCGPVDWFDSDHILDHRHPLYAFKLEGELSESELLELAGKLTGQTFASEKELRAWNRSNPGIMRPLLKLVPPGEICRRLQDMGVSRACEADKHQLCHTGKCECPCHSPNYRRTTRRMQ